MGGVLDHIPDRLVGGIRTDWHRVIQADGGANVCRSPYVALGLS